MSEAGFVTAHRAIIAKLRRLSFDAPAVTVAKLARSVGKDPRVVRRHLRVAAIDGAGLFVDKGETLFAFTVRMERALREAIAQEPAAQLAYASAEALFASEAVRDRRQAR